MGLTDRHFQDLLRTVASDIALVVHREPRVSPFAVLEPGWSSFTAWRRFALDGSREAQLASLPADRPQGGSFRRIA
jgi:hypothetical protein